ncbi:MAG: VOC family protein [Bacteroidota bacterium]
MSIYTCLIILSLALGWPSCHSKKYETATGDTTKTAVTDLRVDHLNIWVNNPGVAEQQLTALGFTAGPDSLPVIHAGQGTAGRYFYFLNGYLELIFVYDEVELKQNNALNAALDFTARANFDKNGAAPFGIALKVKDYEVAKIPFPKVKYHQKWMDENANIYAAKNSKTHLAEPSIFVVYPAMESGTFESVAQLDSLPTEDPSWKSFFKHPNGAQRITDIIIFSNGLGPNTETIKAVNEIENLRVKNGSTHLMELYFDNNIQGKSHDLRPELPLIVYL